MTAGGLVVGLEGAVVALCAVMATFLFVESRGGPLGPRAYLGLLLLLMGIMILVNAVAGTARWAWFQPINLPLELLVGPVLWLQVRSLDPSHRRLSLKDSVHFMPALLGTVLFAVGIRNLDLFVAAVHLGYFTAATARFLRARAVLPARDRTFVRSVLVLVAVALGIRFFVPLAGPSAAGFRGVLPYAVLMGGLLVIGAYSLLSALRSPRLLAGRRGQGDPQDSRAIDEKLDALMETERPYLDPAFSLDELANRLAVPPRLLSERINDRYGINVAAYLNRLRVEEAAKRLADPANRESITTILHEAGFGSKSAFHREFRKVYGMTPSAYRNQAEAGRR